ncbi:MAG: hypothetical protein AAGA64_00215 [Bacteroidota bacterium]
MRRSLQISDRDNSKSKPYIPTFSLGLKPGLDPTKLAQYADELDDEKIYQKRDNE